MNLTQNDETQCTNETVGQKRDLYILGLLPEQDRLAFRRHIFECFYCTDYVYDNLPVTDFLEGEAERYQRGEPCLLTPPPTAHPGPDTAQTARRLLRFAPRKTWAWSLAAAAMLFLALGLGYFHQPALWRAAGTIAIEEDGGARFRKASQELTSGLNALEARDLETAKVKFGAVSLEDPSFYVAQYFLGLCHLKQSDSGWLWTRTVDPVRLDQATTALQRARAASGRDPLYQAKARLALAKAYLLAQDREKALGELAAIERMAGPEEQIGAAKQTADALQRRLR